ncbi:rhodanese-related sulfurtransferase [Clostridium sp. 19966]|uniref:oxygen-dependent tRNA uridine(34) hydroxylase TrhO n=1 Tax=Clostridium sp. 19966 TaxID=2768166 RepID=UPI0028E0167B|nr:rhodanese-related sulfurtransferase [Clostridium sp. 19966]MDT8716828.1 rhodanese-related sulfurtransferase [Clostridium sp. 19966]
MSEKPYRVLLYYKFVTIEDPQKFAEEHLAFCKKLGLKGRILVAKEGLNGTVSGTYEQTQIYMDVLHEDHRFSDMVFKIDEEDNMAFRKMHVRARKSIITLLPEDDVNPNEKVGTYLKPEEWYEMLQRDDVVIVDGRNGYEYDLGHFRGAIKAEVENFKEFPEWIDENLSEHKDKKIMTYCTGGIRCEKLTGVFLEHGFNEVYHLEGGIVTYGKDADIQGRLWDGKCYVFDDRIAVPINHTEEDVVISKCIHCGEATDRYINCTNDDCHHQHFCCEACEEKYEGFCSEECREYIKTHPQRDARVRLKQKLKMYNAYGQHHLKAKEVSEKLKKLS